MKIMKVILLTIFAVAMMGTAQAQSWLTNGLVAYYPFNGNANDESGNGNHATNSNCALSTNRFGMPSQAYQFNGSNSFLTAPAGVYFSGPFTVSAWVNQFAYRWWCRIIDFGNGTGYGYDNGDNVLVAASAEVSGRACLHVYNPDIGVTFRYSVESPLPMRTNRWVQIVATVDQAGNYALFEDGVLIATAPNLGFPRNVVRKYNYIGRANWLDGKYYLGQMDDIRIYNRALSASEVAQLYSVDGFPIQEHCTPHAATAVAQVVNGFVVGATITDPGCGYTNAPLVLIDGGGGSGATATATVSNGVVVGIVMVSAGSGYSLDPLPDIIIASPPFEPSVGINVSRVNVTQRVTLGRRYVLEASSNLANWIATGPAFTATREEYTTEFMVAQTGQFFRLREVP